MEIKNFKSLEIFLLAGLILSGAVAFAAVRAEDESGAWRKINFAATGQDFVCVKVDPRDPQTVYVATEREFIRLDQDRRGGEVVFTLPVGERLVDVFITSPVPGTRLVASDFSVWRSADQGKNWERIFEAKGSSGKKITAIAEAGGIIYVGTNDGVYRRGSSENAWAGIKTPGQSRPVRRIFEFAQNVYWATDAGLYRYQPALNRVDQLFALTVPREEIPEELDNPHSGNGGGFGIRAAGVFDGARAEFFVASDQGIFVGRGGADWKRLPADGLEINLLTDAAAGVVSSKGGSRVIFSAATERGAYEYREGAWLSLYRGMDAVDVRDLEFSPARGGVFYATAERGIYHLPVYASGSEALMAGKVDQENFKSRVVDLRERWQREPGIRDIQRLAVDYAEVHPEKIQEWRRQARKRAWLPSLDVGFDGGADWSRNDSVFGSSSSGGAHYIGPDDKSSSGDAGWDVGLSWDLADLVWSSEQTSIDSRSKLMVELRDDILNQVTRIYFERRRMQIELATVDLPTWEERVDKELRIEELTALIDGLTGGRFSEMLNGRAHEPQ